MPLRILFADDSVTAQNMGKKILTEAGYEVVAVSNGAAAVKKIAEQKPDIIILDIYMPGYSGLEVCEKVRASMATVKTPVLLTVGKVEPFRPEDARRVRADGVIIKPFEASDLLAIIKKFEERINNMPPPLVQAPPPRPAQEIDVLPDPADHHDPHPGKIMQPTVDVPDHMATSSAFSDLLGAEHAYVAPPPPPPVEPVQESSTKVLESEIPVSWRQDVEPQPIIADTPITPIITAVPVAESAPLSEPAAMSELEPVVSQQTSQPTSHPVVANPIMAVPVVEATASPVPVPQPVEAPAVVAATVVEPETAVMPDPIAPGPVLGRPRQIPVYRDPVPQGLHEVVPTAAGPLGDIDIPREPQLEESAEEITRETVADVREPQLVTTPQSLEPAPVASALQPAPTIASFPVTASVPASASHSATATIASEPAVSRPVVAEATPARREVSDVDFEARVAAALKAYAPAAVTETAAVVAAVEAAPVIREAVQHATAVAPPPPATSGPAPSFEYRPPVISAPLVSAPIVSTPEPPPVMPEPVVEARPLVETKLVETKPVVVPEPVAVPEPMRAPEPPAVMEVAKAEPVVPNVSQTSASQPVVNHEAVVAKVEESIPAAAAAVAKAAGGEHDSIAEAVSRVMERMKGDLVDEIVRELKSKK